MRTPVLALLLTLYAPSAFADLEPEQPYDQGHGEVLRSHQKLFVYASPRPIPEHEWRHHPGQMVEGGVMRDEVRIWRGPSIPDYVSLGFGHSELTWLGQANQDTLALYRERPAAKGKAACSNAKLIPSCKEVVRVYKPDGALRLEMDLAKVLGKGANRITQVLAAKDDTLYVPTFCESPYASKPWECGHISAIDISGPTPKVRWKSAYEISGEKVLLHGNYLIVAYHNYQQAAPKLSVVSQETGKVVTTHQLPNAPFYGFWLKGDQLEVALTPPTDEDYQPTRFTLTGFEGATPELSALQPH